MGQKTNVLTLRKLKPDLNLISSNPKFFLYGFQFLKNFDFHRITFNKNYQESN